VATFAPWGNSVGEKSTQTVKEKLETSIYVNVKTNCLPYGKLLHVQPNKVNEGENPQRQGRDKGTGREVERWRLQWHTVEAVSTGTRN